MKPLHRLLLVLLAFALIVETAPADDFAIQDGDTVVFLGDSITAARTYGKHVENYTLLRYPDRKVKFINVGIGGDTADGGLKRLERDVLQNNVSLLTVAYGVNDIGWGFYADDAHRQTHLDAIRGIVKACREKGVRVYICSAAITAEAPDKAEAGFLQAMCDEGMAISKEEGGEAIDVQRTMREIQRRVLKANEGRAADQQDSLHVKDGVHLSDLGQLAMAYAILKGLGAPQLVSAAGIDVQKGVATESEGCMISDVEIDENGKGISFTRLDEGLPFNNGLFSALSYRFVPMSELNRYRLQVINLAPGEYSLTVNNRSVGAWNAQQLANGVEIASATTDGWQPGGPWDAQATALKSLTDARNDVDLATRLSGAYLPDSAALPTLRKQSDYANDRLEDLQRLVARPRPYRFVLAREEPATAPTSPQEQQVFQRHAQNAGRVVVRGSTTSGAVRFHGTPLNRSRRWVIPLIVIVLLAIHVGLIAYSATRHSPTLNEPGHLVAGLSHWEFGRFEVYRVNPPLVHYVAAIPVLIAGYEPDWSGFYDSPGARPEFKMGEDFIRANGERSIWLFTIARWACLPFTVIGGLFCFAWSRELWRSNLAGLISLTLWCFEPNILAHGELITPDCAASAFGLGATYLFWRWLKRPTWGRAAAAGFVLGLAELTKTSWIILFGLWPLLWLLYRWSSRRSEIRSQRSVAGSQKSDFDTGDPVSRPLALAPPPLAHLTLILALALYVLNVGYGFDGTFTKLRDFTFVSHALTGLEPGEQGNRFAESWLGGLPVLVPKQYVRGIDLQKKDFEDYGQPSYLRGEWKDGGWWYYYIYGLAVKTPHGSQAMLVLALFTLAYGRRKRRRRDGRRQPPDSSACDLVVLLTPAIVLLVLVSSQLEFNHHVRYVLPVLGFAFVLTGVTARSFERRLVSKRASASRDGGRQIRDAFDSLPRRITAARRTPSPSSATRKLLVSAYFHASVKNLKTALTGRLTTGGGRGVASTPSFR